MAAAERTVLALLAAGHSCRFGSSKLDEELWGKPLGLHAAHVLAKIPFVARVAVTGDIRLDYAASGYTVVPNTDLARDQSSSLRLATEHAIATKADALLIALADMPCITAAHVHRLLAAATGPEAVVASTDGGQPRPPALFGRAHFAELLTITGDHGARELIRGGIHIIADGSELVDIDTQADLERLRLLHPSPRP